MNEEELGDCKCGDILTDYDKGDGTKFIGCYGCQETEEKCTCAITCLSTKV